MRHHDMLPAWATRQHNRLLARHGDRKIVRWINLRPAASEPVLDSKGCGGSLSDTPSNENVLPFAGGRIAQAR